MKKKLIYIVLIPFLILTLFPQHTAVQAEEDQLAEFSVVNEIIYDIFVDRFNNGGQKPSDQIDLDDPLAYHGGDIVGIIDKLNHLQTLGFTTISLSPIMENAPGGYHGYWIEDFYSVETEFGQMEDVIKLVEEAHKRDIKVMLELVTNYVAKSSPLVEQYPDWFVEVDVEPIPATEWLHEVVAFDQTNPAVQDYLIDVAKFWVEETGIDGFKLHAADQASPEFLERLTTELKVNDPYFFIIATTLQGNRDMEHLHDIEYIDAIANDRVYEKMNEVFMQVDKPVSELSELRADNASTRDLLYIDNILTPRFSNNFAEQGRNAVTTWTMALSYLYFTKGVPIIYQGSEVPMYGPGFPENQYLVDYTSGDPDLEKVYERMSAIRQQFPSLARGDMEELAVDHGFSLWKRTLGNEEVYVAINNDSESRYVTIPSLGPDFQLRGLIHDDTVRENENGEFVIGLDRETAEVYMIEQNTGLNWGFISFVAGVFIIFIGFIIFLSRKQKQRERNQS